MNITFYPTKDYEDKPPLRTPAKQTQYKPKTNPISKAAPTLLCGALLRTSFTEMKILKISAESNRLVFCCALGVDRFGRFGLRGCGVRAKLAELIDFGLDRINFLADFVL